MRQIDVFSDRLDEIFEQGNPTKAQILDAFHKANPRSLNRVFSSVWEKLLFRKSYARNVQIIIYHTIILGYCAYRIPKAIVNNEFYMTSLWFIFALFTIFIMQRTEFKKRG